MEKSQREYYLNEQVKAIQKELGDSEEGADLDELEKKIKSAHMPKEARVKAEAELKKLKLMSPMSAEATVVRNYIDTLVGLPWKKKTKVSTDLKNSEKILDADHYGLEKMKERIVEYLAVQQRVDKLKRRSLPRGAARRRQDLARAIDRARDQPQVRAHVAGRRARRGGDPRPPAHLHRLDARQDPAEHDEGGRAQPALPPGRGRQDGHGLSAGDPSSALLEVLDPSRTTRSSTTTSRSSTTSPT
jgi:ATP-dependent Lon protease